MPVQQGRNAFRVSGSGKSGSRARTNVPQGGGPSKAGLVPVMAKTQARALAFRHHGLPKSVMSMAFTANPRVNESRNIGSNSQNYYGKFDKI
jgi:hypothetical protein